MRRLELYSKLVVKLELELRFFNLEFNKGYVLFFKGGGGVWWGREFLF